MLTKTSPSDPLCDLLPFKGELVRNAFWTVKLRWLGAAAIIGGSILGWAVNLIPHPGVLVVIGLLVLAYNVLIGLAMRSGTDRLTFQRAQRLWLIQFLADVTSLTAIVFYTGGIESPVIIFYVFHVVCAGILLPTMLSYLVSTLATALLAVVGVIQAAWPGLYHPLGLGFAGQYYDKWGFVGLKILAFAGAMHVVVYVTTAISRRLQSTEEQIIQTRDLLNSIISSMSEAVIFLSADGEPLLWNPSAASWLCRGWGVTDSTDSRAVELPQQIEAYIERGKKSSSGLVPKSFTVRTPDGPEQPARQFQVCVATVLDESKLHLGYVIVAEDVTEQRKLGQDLRERNREILAMSKTLRKNEREMAQREKMVAIGTMAAGVAHEIGNPLACLSAVVQLLNRHKHSEKDSRHLHTLQEQIGRIAKIVKQLVDFARPAAAEWVVADLDDLIEQTLKILRYSLRVRQARIESIRNRKLPPVRIVPQQFQQILVNLLLNALDAVEAEPGEQVIRVERLVQDGWVKVTVKDHGCGMTPEQVRQALEPFYTTKSPGKGTGLGLAVCYRFIEHHQGRIDIDSAPGQGTVVTVSFRAHSQKSKKVKSIQSANHRADG